MNLSEENAKAILLDIHEDISDFADNSLSIIFDNNNNSLTYPPGVDLTADEIEALNKINSSDNLRSALKKILADNAAGVVFNLLNNIDGTSDPRNATDTWVGVKLVDLEPNAESESMEDFLHDEFYSTYWDWQNLKDAE